MGSTPWSESAPQAAERAVPAHSSRGRGAPPLSLGETPHFFSLSSSVPHFPLPAPRFKESHCQTEKVHTQNDSNAFEMILFPLFSLLTHQLLLHSVDSWSPFPFTFLAWLILWKTLQITYFPSTKKERGEARKVGDSLPFRPFFSWICSAFQGKSTRKSTQKKYF